MTSSQQTPQQQPSSGPESEPVIPQITRKQAQRINAPARNMIISMVVMILLIIPVLWLMPQPSKNPYRPSVDLPLVAYEASGEAGYHVAAAQQEGWHYNYARWNSQQADGIDYWETGQVTPSNQFIVLTQAAGTNPTWIANTTGGAQAGGSVQAGGVSWELRSLVDAKDKQKVTSYYIGQLEGTTVILSGEAEAAEFQALAEATAAYLKAPASTVEPTPASGIR